MNGKNLMLLREKAGLTRDELSTKAGLGQPQVGRLESGARRGNSDTLRAIADVLAAELGEDVGAILKLLTDPQ